MAAATLDAVLQHAKSIVRITEPGEVRVVKYTSQELWDAGGTNFD